MKTPKGILSITTIFLLCITSIAGILSIDFTKSYEVINQYGHKVMLYGAGIYQHDTYFKAPISIGTDFCILFVLVPLFIYYYHKHQVQNSVSSKLKLISVYGVSLYYSASMAFGVTYNSLFLVYIALFSCSLFGIFYHISTLHSHRAITPTTGIKIFLILAGIALFVAWLPDIIPTLFTGKPLPLIGVYTTEITYILDMGIIAPLCFLSLFLLQRKKPMGTLILAILLKLCYIVGIMMISQTLLQILSYTDIPLIALFTKSISFMILACFAHYFERQLYRMLEDEPIKIKKKHLILCSIGGLFLFILLYWKMPYSPFHEQFIKERQDQAQLTPISTEVCTAEEILQLPEPLQRYCNYISLEGFPKYNVAHVLFDDTDFVFNTASGKKLTMNYDLWLYQNDIDRHAYCSSSMFGIPFDGIDYSTGHQGGMKGILGKAIPLFDEYTDQGYQAGLISWLAECITLNPSILFSPYVTYETVDANHVQATITYKGVSGTGIFTLDEKGAITEFYSDDRQVEKINGVETKLGWKCTYANYQEQNGIKSATKVESMKVFPDHELVYFSSDHFSVHYMN